MGAGTAQGGACLLISGKERKNMEFVVFAGVELLFERGGRFAERLALLARGDERGDAALKLGARVDCQAALADERASPLPV